jgi:hypothetical protein
VTWRGNRPAVRIWRVLALAPIAIALLFPAPAQAFSGAYAAGRGDTDKGPKYVRLRVLCPPRTQSTPRPGDFSYCTGTIQLIRGGRVVAAGPFSVRTNDSHVQRLLVVPGRKGAIPPRSTARLSWRVRSHDGQGNWVVRTGWATITNRHGAG